MNQFLEPEEVDRFRVRSSIDNLQERLMVYVYKPKQYPFPPIRTAKGLIECVGPSGLIQGHNPPLFRVYGAYIERKVMADGNLHEIPDYEDAQVGKIEISPITVDSESAIGEMIVHVTSVRPEARPYMRVVASYLRQDFGIGDARDAEPARLLDGWNENKSKLIGFNPPATEDGKKYCSSYNRETAKEIATAFRPAYEACRSETDLSAKWGTGIIARKAGLTVATVSRYLRAFRELGIGQIDGIALPPKPNRLQPKKARHKSHSGRQTGQ